MPRKFITSDTHFRHANILEFEKEVRALPFGRDFANVDEHDEFIIEQWNNVVAPEDTVYHLGDVAFNTGLGLVRRLNGTKFLILGNHDHKGSCKYMEVFKEIYGCFEFKEYGALATHFPVHPQQLEHRYKYNIHGHLHSAKIDDERYINVCLEWHNMSPVDLEWLMSRKISHV